MNITEVQNYVAGVIFGGNPASDFSVGETRTASLKNETLTANEGCAYAAVFKSNAAKTASLNVSYMGRTVLQQSSAQDEELSYESGDVVLICDSIEVFSDGGSIDVTYYEFAK